MLMTGTMKSILDFSNFFDHQLFIHKSTDNTFYGIKNGTIKQIKFPQHLQKILDDKKVFSKTINSGNEQTILHIFRLGDGHTLFLNDPGTGNVLNGFVLSLITLSSNVCDYQASEPSSDKDMNAVLMDKLVAEFDKEKKKFSVIDKRQKEEIIILEEQAKEAYHQLDEYLASQKDKDAEYQRMKTQVIELAESNKRLEKKLVDAEFTGDFQKGIELKKKNDILRENNRKLVEMIKKSTLSVSDLHSEVEMCLNDMLDTHNVPEAARSEILASINELFSTEKQAIS